MEELNVPNLRFEGFKKNWQFTKLGEAVTKIGSGSTPRGGIEVYQKSGIAFIRSQNVINDNLDLTDIVFIPIGIHQKMKGSSVKPFDILLNITGGSLGRSCVVPKDVVEGNVNQHVCIIRVDAHNDPFFLQLFLHSEKGQKLMVEGQTGSGREGLNFQSIRGFKLFTPSLSEQQKIASFLTAVDNKLQLLNKKKELLTKYKKGVMQKLFSQEIRFKDDEGNDYPNWEEKSLGEVLFEHKTRNRLDEVKEVFSVAKHKGVINQIEHLGRSYASDDISNYKVVRPDDLIYTKSPTSDFPYGIIKQNKLDRKGVVSVLYAVLSPLNKSLGFLLDCYFSSPIATYNYLNPLVQKGAKNTMNIGNQDFLNGAKINLPVLESEQIKIANFLSSLDDKISLLAKQITHSQAYKKGLLQQMFV